MTKLNRMNKRGHLPTIILVIMAIILITTAWFSFLAKSEDFDDKSKELSQLASEIVLSEEYIKSVFASSVEQAAKAADKNNFEESFKEEFGKIVNERDYRLRYGGNFFGKVRNGEYTISKSENTYTIQIEEVQIQAKVGVSEIKRTFDISTSLIP